MNDREARLEVKDYGKGIDPELLHHFNRSGGGSEIGLAGMRLRESGGRLEVESGANGALICAVIPISASIPAKDQEKSVSVDGILARGSH
jgi:signal transduction histidine kinase